MKCCVMLFVMKPAFKNPRRSILANNWMKAIYTRYIIVKGI